MKTKLLVLALSFGLLPSAFALNSNVNKIRVTHIRFDYTGKPTDKGDGLRIRHSFSKPLEHEGGGSGKGYGEWIRRGAEPEPGKASPRNERALWVANDDVKISVRFEGGNTCMVECLVPGVKAVPKLAPGNPARLIETKPRDVWLVGRNHTRPEPAVGLDNESRGEDGPSDLEPKEFCLFEFKGQTGASVAKIQDSWDWCYSDDMGQAKKFDETGVHVVYRVLGVPTTPWYGDTEETYPWVSALEFAIVTCKAEGTDKEDDAMRVVTTELYKIEYIGLSQCLELFTGNFMYTKYITPTTLANCVDSALGLDTTGSILGMNCAARRSAPFQVYDYHCFVKKDGFVYDSCSLVKPMPIKAPYDTFVNPGADETDAWAIPDKLDLRKLK